MSVARLNPELERELERTGLPWTLELRSKHYALLLAGELVGVLSKSPRAARRGDWQLMCARVRREARRLKARER